MPEKEGLHQRQKQAIVWLKQNKNILQLDIAEKMGMTTVGLSRGLARCKEKNFCYQVPPGHRRSVQP